MNKSLYVLITVFLITVSTLIIPVSACASGSTQLTASWCSIESLKKEGTYAYSKGRMANNEYFDENALTCASWDFPLQTKLRITTVKVPKKSIIVEVTDRTNKRFKRKRIDLSKKAFGILAPLSQGLLSVEVKEIK